MMSVSKNHNMIKYLAQILALAFFLLANTSSLADTCPRAQDLNPFLPPAGWSYLIPPFDPSIEGYTFSSAIHSLNGAFYYQQVICRYEVCPSFLCPAFTLISNNTYQEPSESTPPWNHGSVLKYTLTCMPGDHNPEHCVFT
jgi:hypothetical protein